MHPYLYAIVPISTALLASLASFVWLKSWREESSLILGSAVSLVLGFGVFFAAQFALFAFVSSHGSADPVQFLGDSESAHWLFGWRRNLFLFSVIGMPVLFCLDILVLVQALLHKGSRPTIVAILAWGALIAAGWQPATRAGFRRPDFALFFGCIFR